MNLTVQLVVESFISLVIDPWSTGYGFKPSNSYKRPFIGTKQIKWKISFPAVDEPFEEDEAKLVDDVNNDWFDCIPNDDEAVVELEANE